MSNRDLRSSYTQAQYNHRHAAIFAVQLMIVSVLIAATFDSFAIGVASFLISCGLIVVPIFGKIFCVMFACVWAYIGFTMFQDASTIATPIAIAALAFVIGGGINYSGLIGITDAV